MAIGRVKVDPARKRVTVDGTVVRLTATEYDLLAFMAQHPGRTFSRIELLDAVWGGSSYRSKDSVTVHVRRLRMKVEEDPSAPRMLETRRGFGLPTGAVGLTPAIPRLGAPRKGGPG